MKRRDGRVTAGATGWLCLVLAAATCVAQAQDYPTKPVTIICESAAGSTPDVDTRFFAEGLGRIWKQQVITVNRPGGGGSIGARAAAEALPDGYTLYMPALSSFVALPGVAPNLPLQVPRDFTVLGFTAENPMFFAVNPQLGVNTLPELIALAKQKPGQISYATTGVGRLTHLTGELFQMRADIKLLLVPYTGGPSHAVSDVGTGRVDFIIEGYSGVAAAVKAGLAKAIAVRQAAARLARPADRRRDAPGLLRHRLAGDGGAERHARRDPAQGEPGHGDRRRKRRRQEEPRQARQLFARDDRRRSARLRAPAAGDVAAGDGEDRRQGEMK
jgi:tripartite-type tricarboxylate transporter receptor subunit TctC